MVNYANFILHVYCIIDETEAGKIILVSFQSKATHAFLFKHSEKIFSQSLICLFLAHLFPF